MERRSSFSLACAHFSASIYIYIYIYVFCHIAAGQLVISLGVNCKQQWSLYLHEFGHHYRPSWPLPPSSSQSKQDLCSVLPAYPSPHDRSKLGRRRERQERCRRLRLVNHHHVTLSSNLPTVIDSMILSWVSNSRIFDLHRPTIAILAGWQAMPYRLPANLLHVCVHAWPWVASCLTAPLVSSSIIILYIFSIQTINYYLAS